MNVCRFRELEDVNVFLFRVIEFLQFVPESELRLISSAEAQTFRVQCDFLEGPARVEHREQIFRAAARLKIFGWLSEWNGSESSESSWTSYVDKQRLNE